MHNKIGLAKAALLGNFLMGSAEPIYGTSLRAHCWKKKVKSGIRTHDLHDLLITSYCYYNCCPEGIFNGVSWIEILSGHWNLNTKPSYRYLLHPRPQPTICRFMRWTTEATIDAFLMEKQNSISDETFAKWKTATEKEGECDCLSYSFSLSHWHAHTHSFSVCLSRSLCNWVYDQYVWERGSKREWERKRERDINT